MKRLKKYILMFLCVCVLFGEPKVLGWWNLIYTMDYELNEDEKPEVKLFFIQWIKSIGLARKNKTE